MLLTSFPILFFRLVKDIRSRVLLRIIPYVAAMLSHTQDKRHHRSRVLGGLLLSKTQRPFYAKHLSQH